MKKPSLIRLFLIMSTIACVVILIIAGIFYVNFMITSLFGDGLYYIDILYFLIFFAIGIYILRSNAFCTIYKIDTNSDTLTLHTLFSNIQVKKEDIRIIHNYINLIVLKTTNKKRKLYIIKSFLMKKILIY
jgi:hypothetical protein